jgi:carbonic anhydrase/acetyltransferase-like protein (isoleucine patch superfamily)
MLLEHQGRQPRVDSTAIVAPTAVVCGDVTIGPHCLVSFGAILVAEGSPITLGSYVVVRENALIRATATLPVRIGDHVLIGPRSALNGCTIEDEVFLATGVTVLHGARIGHRAEVRVNGIVHVSSDVPAGATVPLGWVAVGNPAEILPPDQHEKIWAIQRPLNFPRVAYGLDRLADGSVDMRELTRRVYASGAAHRDDMILAQP